MSRSRGPLGALFGLLCVAFAGVAAYAGTGEQWIVTAVGAVLSLWMAELAYQMLRH